MSTPVTVYLVFLCLVVAVTLYATGGQIRCKVCGRRCGGRIAGGTLDDPVCVRCVD